MFIILELTMYSYNVCIYVCAAMDIYVMQIEVHHG